MIDRSACTRLAVFRPNYYGFSLVELLIALGIGGVALFALMRTFNMQIQMNSFVREQMEANDLKNHLQMALSDVETCRLNLGSRQVETYTQGGVTLRRVVSASQPTAIRMALPDGSALDPSSTMVAVGAASQGFIIQTTRLSLEELHGPLNRMQGNFVIETKGASGFAGGTLTRKIPLLVSANPATNNIEYCSTSLEKFDDHAGTPNPSDGSCPEDLTGPGGSGLCVKETNGTIRALRGLKRSFPTAVFQSGQTTLYCNSSECHATKPDDGGNWSELASSAYMLSPCHGGGPYPTALRCEDGAWVRSYPTSGGGSGGGEGPTGNENGPAP